LYTQTSAPAGTRPKVQPPPSKRATRPTQRANKMSGRELGWTHKKSPSMQSPPPRLPSAGGSVRSSVYEFCAGAPKSSRGLGGARELEMGRPAANCPACEQSQVSRTKQGKLERERSDAEACRAGTTATPSRLPGVNGLFLHKSNLMQNVVLLCCEEPPTGRDGEQKIHLKITKNSRRKNLQENKEKLEDYFLPPSTSPFSKTSKKC